MTNTKDMIADLLNFFYENYKATGNIWGITLDLPYEEIDPTNKTIIFASIDTPLSAIKEILLTRFSNKQNLSLKDYKDTLDTINIATTDLLGRYISVVDNLRELAKKVNADFYFYNRSVGIEFLHWGHKNFFDKIRTEIHGSLNAAKRIIVYSPLEYLALSKIFGEKVLSIFDIDLKTISLPDSSTYQESCILARRFGKQTYWSRIIKSIPIKHPLSGNLTACCGEFIWYLHPRMTILNAFKRLKDFESFGANELFVSCPSALAIFNATKSTYPELKISIRDLLELMV